MGNYAECQSNKAWLTVDDGRHGEDDTIAIVDNGVGGLVLDDVEIVPQVAVRLQAQPKRQLHFKQPLTATFTGVYLVQAHELHGSELLGLVEGPEVYVGRGLGRVREGAAYGVQVVGADGHQGPFPEGRVRSGTESLHNEKLPSIAVPRQRLANGLLYLFPVETALDEGDMSIQLWLILIYSRIDNIIVFIFNSSNLFKIIMKKIDFKPEQQIYRQHLICVIHIQTFFSTGTDAT